MPEWLIGILVSAGVGLGTSIILGVFAKKFPKEKTYNEKIKPLVVVAANATRTALNKWVGESNADKLEEGIGCTLAFWIENSARDFDATLRKDNK